MRWRDIRFEKPTEADGDKDGRILQLLSNGICGCFGWSAITCVIAWCPTSELPAFEPIPDPPEGWRFVEKGEAFDKRAKCWCKSGGWQLTQKLDSYDPEMVYIIPINPPEPPEPQYRPFANAAEFEPYFGRMIKEKSHDDFRTIVTAFNDKGVWLSGAMIATNYSDAINIFEFADGTPFGVKVQQ